ncbi:unnamed protein product, partial [Choristocarpus tenellus]
MSEAGGLGGSGSSRTAVKKGYEVYEPGARAGARRGQRLQTTDAASTVFSEGTNTFDAPVTVRGRGSQGQGLMQDRGRGHLLWDPDDDAGEPDREWKRDKGGAGEPPPRPRARNNMQRRAGEGSLETSGVEEPSVDRYDDLNRKVEEEVVRKLARAQMMGMMLKAHREKEEAGKRGGG